MAKQARRERDEKFPTIRIVFACRKLVKLSPASVMVGVSDFAEVSATLRHDDSYRMLPVVENRKHRTFDTPLELSDECATAQFGHRSARSQRAHSHEARLGDRRAIEKDGLSIALVLSFELGNSE